MKYAVVRAGLSVDEAHDEAAWDLFLKAQTFRPFLQSFTMGEVYRECGEEPLRLEVRSDGELHAVCHAVIVPARRGKHIAIPYGPVFKGSLSRAEKKNVLMLLLERLRREGLQRECNFLRLSPFWVGEEGEELISHLHSLGFLPSPLHMLAEHVLLLDLRGKSEEQLMASMRKTTRYLIRQGERMGVEVRASKDPLGELPIFLAMHEETKRRHHFTPYSESFFRAQIRHFAPQGACTLYVAWYKGEPLASSIHMHFGGETSYHHGGSSSLHPKVPASYVLQWKAICDALKRGDHLYNFWGIAPSFAKASEGRPGGLQTTNYKLQTHRHPFAGVTLFKTGFGGTLLELPHCMDLPLSPGYHLTRTFEYLRKWQRGF